MAHGSFDNEPLRFASPIAKRRNISFWLTTARARLTTWRPLNMRGASGKRLQPEVGIGGRMQTNEKSQFSRLFRALPIALGAACLLLGGYSSSAQSASGSIVGTVRDSSGKVIVGAQVTALNVATNNKITVVTNDLGFYSFPVLQPTSYQIAVKATGFKELVRSNIQLDVAMTLTVNADLVVGQVTETVSVNDEPPLLETQTSSLGQLIGAQQMDDLPLSGRNSYSFATLVPGVVAPYQFTQPAVDEYNDQFISINGSRPNQNVFLLDGGTNSEPAFSGPGYFPSVDLVQEYKVQTNNLGAEFSNTGGGVVNVITKSGSNKFHGSAWEFNRTKALEANSFFSIRAGLPRGDFSFNQYGGTFGGPLQKDRMFFFFGYEGLNWTQSGTASGNLPTAAERSGDFSADAPIYDPFSTTLTDGVYNRTQYQNNRITNIDPVAAALLTYLPPATNEAAVPNYTTNFSMPIKENSFSFRLDRVLTPTSKIFARYSINDTNQIRPALYGTSSKMFVQSSPQVGTDFLRQQQATVDYTNAIKSNLFLDLNSSFVRYFLDRMPPGQGFNTASLPFNQPTESDFAAIQSLYTSEFPTMFVSGLGLGESVGNIGFGELMGAFTGVPKDVYSDLREYGNAISIHGRHTIKLGGDFGIEWLTTERYRESALSLLFFNPGFTQGPNPFAAAAASTGSGLASMEAGLGFATIPTGGTNEYISGKYYGFYGQDDWRITDKFTANLGIRYDYNAPWLERYNRFTNWDPTIASPLQTEGFGALSGGLTFPGVNGVPRGEFDPQHNGFAPRLGIEYAVTPTTTVRAGYGMFYAPLSGGGYNGNTVPTSGFSSGTPWVSSLDGVTPANTLSNAFPNGFNLPSGASLGSSTLLGQPVVGMLRKRNVAYAEQWNLDVQQSLPGKLLVDVAYAGGRGVHLYGDFNSNQLPDTDLAQGSALSAQVNNPFYGQISSGALSGPTVAASQLLLPFPQFTGVTLGNSSFYGKSLYNALQAKLERRFADGFSLQAAYTWSKLEDNLPASETGFPGGTYGAGSIQDYDNLRAEWAVASFDTPHYLAINGIYELPFGTGKRFGANNKATNYIIGGWQVEGITSFASGSPLGVTTAAQNLGNNGGTQRANWSGKNPSKGGKVADRLGVGQYFDVTVFSAPGAYTYGNSPRSVSQLRSDAFINTDMSAIKNTKIHDQLSWQFRVEAFNLFNHPVFGPPDTTLGDGTTGLVGSTTNNPRQIQLAVKVLW
jgi:hypothetical protein